MNRCPRNFSYHHSDTQQHDAVALARFSVHSESDFASRPY